MSGQRQGLSAGGPRYLKLAHQLREWFQRGGVGLRQPLPSLRRLAAEFHVGLQIVRQAIDVLEKEGTLVRNARSQFVLSSERPGHGIHDIVTIVQTFGKKFSPDMSSVISGLLMELAGRELPCLVVHGAKQLRFGIPPGLLELPLKGMLLYGQFSDRVLRQYEKLKVPIVLVDQPSSSQELRSISIDNVEAARDATARMIAMGHRRIAMLRFLPISVAKIDPDSRERQRGFAVAAEAAGLSHSEARIYTRSGAEMANSRTLKRMLSETPRITAVLTVDTVSSKAVMDTATSMGLSIPGDLSIVTFHSQMDVLEHPWSGPRADFLALGKAAVSLLSAPASKHLRVKPVWNDGATLAPPKSG